MELARPEIDKPEGDIPFELGIEDIEVGDGNEATKGKKVSVHYVGVAFSTGEEFDASWNRGQPFEFKLGSVAAASSRSRRRWRTAHAGRAEQSSRTSRWSSWSICSPSTERQI
jgi:hypothetical protein